MIDQTDQIKNTSEHKQQQQEAEIIRNVSHHAAQSIQKHIRGRQSRTKIPPIHLEALVSATLSADLEHAETNNIPYHDVVEMYVASESGSESEADEPLVLDDVDLDDATILHLSAQHLNLAPGHRRVYVPDTIDWLAKRKMTIQQIENHRKRVIIHKEIKQLKQVDSFEYLNQGVNVLTCPIRRSTIETLRQSNEKTKAPDDPDDPDVPDDPINPEELQQQLLQQQRKASIRQDTIQKIQRLMNKRDFGSYAAPHNDFQSSTKSIVLWLRRRVRNINDKLYRACRDGNTKQIDRFTRQLTALNRDLLIIRRSNDVAELGACCALIKVGDAKGTSQRDWIQVHESGAKWLKNTRVGRIRRKIADRRKFLEPGEVRARRTLSPLLKQKVGRMRLQSEIDMEEFSLTHHRLNLPGMARQLTWQMKLGPKSF